MPADDPMYQRALELLERFGAVSVEHPSGTLLEHLRGTYEQLDRWGCSKDLCRAGLYHSVYGTEKFQKRTVPLEARNEVRSAIGERAEEIAYLYCALSRQSLYRNLDVGAPYVVKTQDGGERPLSLAELADLMTLDLANRLEQLPRTRHDAMRIERDRVIYERAVPLLPGAAVAEFRSTFPRHSKTQLFATKILRRPRRALRSITRRLKRS
ncbi:MAG: DUF6817 domain-containing protein [Gemmatimonadales bacterium]